MTIKKKFFYALSASLTFSVFSSGSLHAEGFRVRNVVRINVDSLSASLPAKVGINDGLLLSLPKDKTYISGIELNIKIPEAVATWRDSVAYTLYSNLQPEPQENRIDYTGEKLMLNTVPGKFSMTAYFPLSEDFSIKSNPYSVIISKMPEVKESLFIRFQLAMKGVPESLENSSFEITAKPVLSDKGKLSLSILPVPTESKSLSIYIDDIPVKENKEIFLKTGEHHLSIVSDSYRNELRTFRIEQAKTTKLSIQLRGIEPTLKILSPSNAAVFLDEKKFMQNEEHIIEAGEHKIKFILGDYELTKTLSAVNGRSYTVNLNIDANISEED